MLTTQTPFLFDMCVLMNAEAGKADLDNDFGMTLRSHQAAETLSLLTEGHLHV